MTNGTASTPAPTSRAGGGVALLVSGDQTAVRQVKASAAQLGISVEPCTDCTQAAYLLNHRKFEAVIVDIGDRQENYSVLEQVRASTSNPTAVTFVITAGAANPATRTGSNFVLQRPLTEEAIDRTLRAAYGLIVRELRRHFRCSMTVSAVLLRPGTEALHCETFDLSEGGMGLNTSSLLEPGTEVTIDFTLPGQDDPMRVAAEVCWCSPQGRVGVRFADPSAAQRSELQGWLSSRLEKVLPEGVVARFRTSRFS
ncbi:MAG TPA: PilZ domain-containing protein [Terriglobales bacterium]